uniref:Uncharacterized protein n=1 Tax=Arundo donax TaxID=35708 RepID=A0A0A9G7U8_ARUDO
MLPDMCFCRSIQRVACLVFPSDWCVV